MKKPITELPWYANMYGIASSKNNLENWSYDVIGGSYDGLEACKDDLLYIEEACNNFPKAVELLKKLIELEAIGVSQYESEVNSFLKQLNN